MVISQDSWVVIDVRTAEEFAEGHLPEALNIPYETIGDEIAAVAPGKGTRILLYCKSGGRSGVALTVLRKMGYARAENGGGYESLRKSWGSGGG